MRISRLMSALERFATSRFIVSLVILVLMGLLIWYFGPELHVNDRVPFASPVVRIATIAGLAVTFLLFEMLRRWRLRRINRNILSRMGGLQAKDSLQGRDVGRIRVSFARFLRLFQQRGGIHGSQKRQLRTLSWYLLLGEQQAGRTAALDAADMEFPLEGPIEPDGSNASDARGFCEWRVTDKAVYVDVPGELTFQRSQLDMAEWSDLCDCLASVRRVRPLSGVVLTVPASALLSEEQDAAKADAIRSRLQELMARFGEYLPVYVLVTKSDLITGFADFFAHLEIDERNRPLGVQIPLMESWPRSRRWWQAENEFTAEPASLAAYRSRFQEFTVQLSNGTFARLAEEQDAESRRRIFSFPQQMLALSMPIEKFLQRIFSPSRFRHEAMFRGVYFCSASQPDDCIDMLMRAHEDAYGLKAPANGPQRRLGGEAAYFCKGFMHDVLLSERMLRSTSPASQRRRLHGTVSICAAVFVLCGALIYSWSLVLGRSHEEHIAFTTSLDEHATLSLALPDEPELEDAALSVAPLLTAVETSDDDGLINMLMREIGALTLQPSLALHEKMKALYLAADGALVRPALARDLGQEVSLLANADKTSLNRLNDTLALYLGLSALDRQRLEPLVEWAEERMQRRFPADPKRQEDAVKVVRGSLANLNDPITLDGAVVSSARMQLFGVPLSRRAYNAAKEKAKDLPAYSIRDALGEERAAFVSRDTESSLPSVAGYYTESGYYESFIPEIPKHILEERDREWMAGTWTTELTNEEILAETSALLAKDFAAEWSTALDSLAFRDVRDVAEAHELYDLLLSGERPLDGLVALLYAHTKLPAVRGTEPGPTGAGSEEAGKSMVKSSGEVLESLNKAVEDMDVSWPGVLIRDTFEPYHALHEERTGEMSGLKDVHARLGDIHRVLLAVQGGDSPGAESFEVVARWMDDPLQSELTALRQAATSLPSALRRMLYELADQTQSALMDAARRHIEETWDSAVLAECTRGIHARYPVSRQAQIAIAPDDFERFFLPAGAIGAFFDLYAEPYLKNGFERGSKGFSSIGFSEPALDAFRNAQMIREAFALDRAALRDAAFTIEPEFLDSEAVGVMIETNSRSFSYRHEPPRRFRMRVFDESVSISLTDESGRTRTVRVTGPWSWFRIFDRFELQPTATPDHFVFRVEIDGLFAVFRITADSTVNPFTTTALTEFKCEEDLL